MLNNPLKQTGRADATIKHFFFAGVFSDSMVFLSAPSGSLALRWAADIGFIMGLLNTKKIVFALIAFNIFLSFIGVASAGEISITGMEEMAQTIKKAVFAAQIEGDLSNQDESDDWILLGTGFFIRGKVRKKSGVYLGITCRHIVEAAKKANKKLYIGMDTKSGYRRFHCRIEHIDQNYDLAIITPQKKAIDEAVEVETLRFTQDHLASNAALVEGRAVIIPGYPLGLGVAEDRNHPVVRFGIIAQYATGDTFLVDGVVSHGNSGSPVFLLKHRKVAGMIVSYQPDHISLFDEGGHLTARFPYNSGISKAITGQVIAKVLREFNK